jgi:hypothetical protein
VIFAHLQAVRDDPETLEISLVAYQNLMLGARNINCTQSRARAISYSAK